MIWCNDIVFFLIITDCLGTPHAVILEVTDTGENSRSDIIQVTVGSLCKRLPDGESPRG